MLSLAKLQTFDLKLMSNRSFKKMFKRRSPSMEPCGTIIIVYIHELKAESSFILWRRLER